MRSPRFTAILDQLSSAPNRSDRFLRPRPGAGRWCTRAGVVVAGVLLAALAAAAPAWAHNRLLSADPADGAHLTAAPLAVRLVFVEPADARFIQVAVSAGDGHSVGVGAATVHATTLTQPLPPLPAGR